MKADHPNSRKPDYRLRAMNKRSELKATIGAAWINENGSISIALDPFARLLQDGDLVLTLFPVDAPAANETV